LKFILRLRLGLGVLGRIRGRGRERRGTDAMNYGEGDGLMGSCSSTMGSGCSGKGGRDPEKVKSERERRRRDMGREQPRPISPPSLAKWQCTLRPSHQPSAQGLGG